MTTTRTPLLFADAVQQMRRSVQKLRAAEADFAHWDAARDIDRRDRAAGQCTYYMGRITAFGTAALVEALAQERQT